jgi:predicted nucleotide-binding protein (sugar kinase/HSP70/actin superfamily)
MRKISFPHMGNYYIAFKPLLKLFSDEIIVPPPITKKTIELGSRYSPDSACVPFKYNLGNYIEALDEGADLLIQAGGGCRFGYYAEVQKEILKNLGYKFEFLKLDNQSYIFKTINTIKSYNKKNTIKRIIKSLLLCILKVKSLDLVDDYIRKNIGFEKNKGEYEKKYKKFLTDLDNSNSIFKVIYIKRKYLKQFKQIEINKPKNPIKIGIVGELYILMEPYSNFFIEKELAKKGIEVHRFVTLSTILHDSVFSKNHKKKLLQYAKPYLKYDIGAHGTESVAMANKLIKEGFDGIMHVKPFGCMPEVNAMSALHKISKDNNFPILCLSYDSLTSETGIKTRLEAFYDMLISRRKKK